MGVLRNTRLAVVAAGLLAATVGVTATPATADGPVTVAENAGTIRLNVDNGTGSITFTPPGGGTPVVQTIAVSRQCEATTNGSVLTVAVTGATNIGVNDSNLGARTKNNCATETGRIIDPQTLSLDLNDTLFAADVRIVRAELDIEGKKNADLGVALDDVAIAPQNLGRAASDNGPDSGIGDNDRVIVAGNFRKITLSAVGTGAEVSLNGGGDGTYAEYQAANLVSTLGTSLGTADTVFQLMRDATYADDLTCLETRTATIIGGSAEAASVTRLTNTGGGTCQDIPITFEILDEGVLLDKSTLGLGDPPVVQQVNLVVDITWAPQTAQMPLPARQINLTPDNPNTWQNVQWCTSWDPATQTAVHPSGVPWCLVSDNVILLPNGQVKQVQKYHGSGDPLWK